MDPISCVALRPWAADDLRLLERLLGDPAMMLHLGGPETSDAIRKRHARYLASDPARGGLFAIVVGVQAEPAGWVGYWESEWRDESVWECGWHVLPEHQGRGVATAATRLLLERVRLHGGYRYVHAFPSVGNAASNGMCRTLGFVSMGEVDVEYPKGSMMRSTDWCFDLERTASVDFRSAEKVDSGSTAQEGTS